MSKSEPDLTVKGKNVLEKLQQLEDLVYQMNDLKYNLENLQEEIILEIIEGKITHDPLVDFVMVACGAFDPLVINIDYRPLVELPFKKPGQQVLVIQKANYNYSGGRVTLRNIYLASLRPDKICFDLNKVCFRLPVEIGSSFYWEVIVGNTPKAFLATKAAKWLTVGPLRNQYCEIGPLHKDDYLYVPKDAVCEIELLPMENKEILFQEHDIDSNLLRYLYQKWIRGRTRIISDSMK